jgi:hypothetical protein
VKLEDYRRTVTIPDRKSHGVLAVLLGNIPVYTITLAELLALISWNSSRTSSSAELQFGIGVIIQS